jgi:hypothetical protein
MQCTENNPHNTWRKYRPWHALYLLIFYKYNRFFLKLQHFLKKNTVFSFKAYFFQKITGWLIRVCVRAIFSLRTATSAKVIPNYFYLVEQNPL